jgi:hypothetical protein
MPDLSTFLDMDSEAREVARIRSDIWDDLFPRLEFTGQVDIHTESERSTQHYSLSADELSNGRFFPVMQPYIGTSGSVSFMGIMPVTKLPIKTVGIIMLPNAYTGLIESQYGADTPDIYQFIMDQTARDKTRAWDWKPIKSKARFTADSPAFISRKGYSWIPIIGKQYQTNSTTHSIHQDHDALVKNAITALDTLLFCIMTGLPPEEFEAHKSQLYESTLNGEPRFIFGDPPHPVKGLLTSLRSPLLGSGERRLLE